MSAKPLHPVLICGASEDTFVLCPHGGVMLYSKALEPLVVIGFCEQKWLLVSNSAGLLSWFCLAYSEEIVSAASSNGFLPIRQQSFLVSAASTEGHQFNLQYLHNLYSADQIRRMFLSISDSIRKFGADAYCPEADCVSRAPQCSGLPEEEFEFYSNITWSWVNENLSNVSCFPFGELGVCILPVQEGIEMHKRDKDESLPTLCKWLAENVRASTGLKYSEAMASANAVVSALNRSKANGGVIDEEHGKVLFSILADAEEESDRVMRLSAAKSPDKQNLEMLLESLMGWVDDAQRSATWRNSAADLELLNKIEEMTRILEDADPALCVDVLQKASPQALESIAALYQLENAQDIRKAIRDFVLCWMHLLFTFKSQDPTNTVMLRMFASDAGGGVFLGELLREFISNDSLSETALNSIMSVCAILIENRQECLPNAELPCDISSLFDNCLRVTVTHISLLPLYLELVERVVTSSVDNSKTYAALMSSSLFTCQNADTVEMVIDSIIHRYLSLTIDKYLSNRNTKDPSDPVFNKLIAVLMFWAHTVADPRLLEQGLVHTSDLNVLIDFCNRQIEVFEIDSSCPKSLQDAYTSVRKLFITVTSMEFF